MKLKLKTPSRSRWHKRALTLALTLAACAAQATTYTIVDLGTLGGSESFVSGMSNSGWVTGNSTDASNNSWAFLFRAGSPMANLAGLSGATNSQGAAVNDLGQVVGNSDLSGTGISHASIWSAGNVSDLGSLGSPANVYNSFGFGINAGGQAVGTSGSQSFGSHGFFWDPIAQTMSDVFATTNVQVGSAINSFGDYTGSSATDAILVINGTATTLWPGAGLAINDSDQVAGYQLLANGPSASLYSSGSTISIGTLGGYTSIAFALDTAGDVVGTADTNADINNPVPHAFLYTKGSGMQDLNGFIDPGSGWELQEARGIADNGVIVGNGVIGGQSHGFMLIPDNGGDSTPPFTMAMISGNLTGPRMVGLKATDPDDPVASTSYTTGAGSATYTGPFSVGLGSTQVVQFNSADYHGNVENVHQLDVVFDPVAGNFPVTVQYDTVTSPGNASVTVSNVVTPPAGFATGSPVRYYDVTTSAGYSGSVIVGLSYAGVNLPGSGIPRAFHMEGGVWVDSTFAVDTVNQMVYAQTSSLSPFAVFAPLQPFSTFTVSPTSVYNGASSTATLTMRFPAEAATTPWSPSARVPGEVIKLTSANPAVTIPVGSASNGANVFQGPDGNTYLFLPQGMTQTDFQLNTSQVSASTKVAITASLFGYQKTTNLTVTPESLSSVVITPTSVYNGLGASGTVTLAQPAYTMQSPFGGGTIPGDMVMLTSSNAVGTINPGSNPDGSNVFQGPDGNIYMFIPQGNTSGTFSMSTSSVSARTVVTFTASLLGSTRSDTLAVTPEAVQSISLSPTSVYNGLGSTGTVTLAHPAFNMTSPFGGGTIPGDLVQLTSGDPTATVAFGSNPDGSNVFQGPDGNTYMFIPQGNTSGTLMLNTGPVSAKTIVSITAALFGTTRTANLTVTPETVSAISLSPSSVMNGVSSTGTVTLGHPAFIMTSPFGGGTIPGELVLLTSGSSAGTFAYGSSPDGSNVFQGPDGNVYMFVPQGGSTGTFTVNTAVVTSQTTDAITASINGTSRTANLTIKPTLVQSITVVTGTLHSGQSTSGSVTLNSPAMNSPSPFGGGTTSGVLVMLTSDNALVTFPQGGNPDGSNVFVGPDGNTYVYIPTGSTSGTITVSVGTVPVATTAVITAALNGGSKTKSLTLKP